MTGKGSYHRAKNGDDWGWFIVILHTLCDISSTYLYDSVCLHLCVYVYILHIHLCNHTQKELQEINYHACSVSSWIPTGRFSILNSIKGLFGMGITYKLNHRSPPKTSVSTHLWPREVEVVIHRMKYWSFKILQNQDHSIYYHVVGQTPS
jgi:hypothetical protein